MGCTGSKDVKAGDEIRHNTAAQTGADAKPSGNGNAAVNATSKPNSKKHKNQVASSGIDMERGQTDADVEVATAQVFGREVLASRIQMMFSCRNLINRDTFSKSDPLLVVRMNGVEAGRTEVVRDNLNPDFIKAIEIVYRFEERQLLEIDVVDVDSEYSAANVQAIDLKKQDYLGSSSVVVGEIIGSLGMTKLVPIKVPQAFQNRVKPQAPPFIRIIAMELPEQNPHLSLQFAGEDLDKKDLLGKSDPFLKISRKVYDPDSNRPDQMINRAVFQSEARKQTLNPTWSPFSISLARLCGNDTKNEILIECYDWDRTGSNDLIGAVSLTVDALISTFEENSTLDLINEKRRGHSSVAGRLRILKCERFQKPTFLDYVAGGCEIGFAVAIDLTASNKPVSNPKSLHHYAPGVFNPYMQAIISIGAVLEYYDSDQMFPMYGFGARLPWKNNEKSHCFALNFDPNENAEVKGIQGILDTYMRAVSAVVLSGPTLFSEVIQAACKRAQRPLTQARQHYDILLIITDGIIDDMDKTVLSIIECSKLPMSIIIVGVGDADFTSMNVLDSDTSRLGSKALGYVERDIVQFVPFRDFVDTDSREIDQFKFAKSLLEEIPAQVLSYFESRHINANPRRSAPEELRSPLMEEVNPEMLGHDAAPIVVNQAPAEAQPDEHLQQPPFVDFGGYGFP
mmetsp:Transcript_5176/g.9026  ORF Transcript_5176/g.9026 Transcript_5176/m.9026 type:complete len:682 (-) Transcript_5176:1507-3552(-)